jgi:hypothetical protein
MRNVQSEIIYKPLHPQAAALARKLINDQAASLILQAKILAFQRDAELVLSSDVQEAMDAITKERTQTWKRQLIIVLGGAFFGAFVQGFLTALSTGNASMIAVYTVLGFFGMILVFWGLRR